MVNITKTSLFNWSDGGGSDTYQEFRLRYSVLSNYIENLTGGIRAFVFS